MPTNPANYLGTPITAIPANDYLQTNAILKDRMSIVLDEATIRNHASQINRGARPLGIPRDNDRAPKMINLFNDDNNAYVFSKDDFLRFFEDDPNDPHRHLQFTHCLILVGSLPAPKGSRQMGEQTIVIAGCTQLNATTYVTNVRGDSLLNVATEHPPRTYDVKITDPVTPQLSIRELI